MAAPPITERHLHHFHRRSPIKESVRVATTANITIVTALNNGDTLDGITLATDDRVLVKDQSTGSQNGIYVVGVTPVRSYDVSTDDPAFGYLVRVREGTVNGAKVFANTNTATPTIDTTALTFAALPSSDLSGIDFLVGTATGLLSAEIVVGGTPSGELGGTWASPTVDGTHSGSAHTDFIAKSLLTTQDDIIVRDGTGPARLAKGSDGQVLTVDPTTHHLVWATPSSGFSNPMTTKGDLIVGDTGGSPIRKAVGADTEVLTADSTATGGVKWAAGGGGSGGLSGVLEQHTGSASATLDFTSFISATYDDYLIKFVNVIPATNDTALRMRMGTGAGPTFDTGANYGWGIFIWRAGGSAFTGGETGQTFISLNYGAGGTLGVNSSTNYGFSGSVLLLSPQSTALYKEIVGDTFYLDAEPFRIRAENSGQYQSTTAVTAVQFYFSSGNVASGTIRIYGFVK